MAQSLIVESAQSSRRFPKRCPAFENRRKRKAAGDFSVVLQNELRKSHPDESLKIKTKPL